MVGVFDQSVNVDPYHQYAKLRDDTDLNLAAGTLVAFEKHGTQLNKAYSAFAQMILKPIDQLEIAGGARYTHETKASTLFNLAEHGRASFPYGKRSEEHTSELQSLMRISSAVFCSKHKRHKLHKNKLRFSPTQHPT